MGYLQTIGLCGIHGHCGFYLGCLFSGIKKFPNMETFIKPLGYPQWQETTIYSTEASMKPINHMDMK